MGIHFVDLFVYILMCIGAVAEELVYFPSYYHTSTLCSQATLLDGSIMAFADIETNFR